MKTKNEVILENGITVKGATLLTAEEAVKLSKETRAIGRWWWLRSPGYDSDYAAFVYSDGSVYYGDCNVYGANAVRPALIIRPKASNLRIGDTFRFGGKDFEIISDTLALCTESIGKCAFREDWDAPDANDYEASDIKKFVDSWYQDVIRQLSQTAQKEDKTENMIRLENGLEILGATLLTVEEAEKLPEETRAIGCWWWLRSPGGDNGYAAGVGLDGSINYHGAIVFHNGGFIRPVLMVDIKSSNLAIGDRFRFWNKEFEIISDTSALCTESIGDCAFRENWRTEGSNNYEKSDAKKFVNDWFHDAVCEFSQTGTNEKIEMETQNKVVLENGLEIAGITLLTMEEAEKLPRKTREIGCWWWLRSPGDYRRRVVTVCSDGFVYYDDICANIVCDVRPALMVSNPESADFNIGDRFRFGEKEFEIISADRALCTESIGKCAFREEQKARDANRYETSDVKKFVDKWYQDVINGQINSSEQKKKYPAEIKSVQSGDIRIMGITLLTAEEAGELPKNILATGKRWWLKTPGSRYYAAAVVDPDGFVDDCGWVVNKPWDVRPALIISYPEHSGVKIGDKFYFANEKFQVVSAERALCTENFGWHPFRKKANVSGANDYSDSDVKKFLDEWYANSIRKQTEIREKEQKQQISGSDAASGNFDCMLEELRKLQKKAIEVKNEEVSFYATGMMEKAIRIVEKYR